MLIAESYMVWNAAMCACALPIGGKLAGLPCPDKKPLLIAAGLDGLMSLGTMMAGLLVGAGVGILVLLKVNENKKESLGIIGLLYGIGVFAGILLNLIG